jgi:2-dehydro-3-deoxyphosphogluconate aldolase/(4S)-4-hydroxy-2-oxoglutarate aldolase
VDAVIAGGFKCVEITLSVPRALDLVEEYAKHPGITMAVGTIYTVEECIASVKAGAKILVTPCLVPEVTKWCAENNVCHICGIMTPSEAYNAHKLGAHVTKLFPGQAGGPMYLKAIRGPMPFLRVAPTTGVLLENVNDYFEAGAFHVGWTAVLFPPAEVANGQWDRITARAKSYVDACNAAPGGDAALAASKLE